LLQCNHMRSRFNNRLSKFWKHHKLLSILIGIILLSLAAKQLSSIVSIESFRAYIASFGATAPILFIVLYGGGRLLPVVGAYVSPLFLVSVLIFPPPEAIVYVIAANLISTTINFVLARKYGYKMLGKIFRPKALKEIQKASHKLTPQLVAVFRFLPTHIAGDVVSYAAGMSKMTWKSFTIATTLSWGILTVIPLYSYNYFLKSNNGLFLLPWYWVITFPLAYYILKSRGEYKVHLQNFFHKLRCYKHQLSCELRGRPVVKRW